MRFWPYAIVAIAILFIALAWLYYPMMRLASAPNDSRYFLARSVAERPLVGRKWILNQLRDDRTDTDQLRLLAVLLGYLELERATSLVQKQDVSGDTPSRRQLNALLSVGSGIPIGQLPDGHLAWVIPRLGFIQEAFRRHPLVSVHPMHDLDGLYSKQLETMDPEARVREIAGITNADISRIEKHLMDSGFVLDPERDSRDIRALAVRYCIRALSKCAAPSEVFVASTQGVADSILPLGIAERMIVNNGAPAQNNEDTVSIPFPTGNELIPRRGFDEWVRYTASR